MVDVKDVARLHVMALKKTGAGSICYFGTGSIEFADAAQMLIDDSYRDQY